MTDVRTNIDIDDKLMAEALKSGYATKRAAVEAGLRMLAQRRKAYAELLALGGTGWDGDLDAWRQDKPRPVTDQSPRVTQPKPAYRVAKSGNSRKPRKA